MSEGNDFKGIGEHGGTDLGTVSNVTGGTDAGSGMAGSAAGASASADLENDTGMVSQGSADHRAAIGGGQLPDDSGPTQEDLHRMGSMDDKARRMEEAMPMDVSDGSAAASTGGAM